MSIVIFKVKIEKILQRKFSKSILPTEIIFKLFIKPNTKGQNPNSKTKQGINDSFIEQRNDAAILSSLI